MPVETDIRPKIRNLEVNCQFMKKRIQKTQKELSDYSLRKLTRSARGARPIKLKTNTHAC
jgi:hypothetical protein